MSQTFLFPKVPALLHGGDYNPDQWLKYPDILDRDIELMKEAHINCVSMGIFAWSMLEPEEGRYDFEWLDERIDTLYKNGIYTILATPSGARPAWLDRKYPEAMRVNKLDQRNHHGVRHNHCQSSPQYRRKVREMNTQLASRYASHPGLIAWHVSNEYGGECYCPLCTERFREFLKDQYHTIDTLNDAWWSSFWSHRYTSFEEIEPPFQNGETSMAALTLDWKRFTTWNTLDFMREEIRPLRELAPSIPVTTNFMHLYGGLDYQKLAGDLDVISWDSYPFWHRPSESMGHTAAVTAFSHSQMRNYKQGQPFLLMESAPGLVNWQPYNKIRRPGMHRLSSLQAIACGSDSVQYFQFRKCRGSFEQFHGAVVDHEGSHNTRIFREVAELGTDLEKLRPVAGSRISTPAALIMDTPNRWAVELISGLSEHKQMMETVCDHYEAFTACGCDLDVITSETDFSAYRLLILPMLYMVNDHLAERIRKFVETGGTVISTYLLGYVGDTLLAHLGGFPGSGLREVFGIWNEEIDSLYPEERNALITSSGERYTVKDYCEVLHAETAEVVATYESDYYQKLPAVTVSHYGKGHAIYIGARTEEDFLKKLYGETARKLGFSYAQLPDNVEMHIREDDAYTYTFILNFNDTPAAVPEMPQGTDLLSGRTSDELHTLPAYGAVCIQTARSR